MGLTPEGIKKATPVEVLPGTKSVDIASGNDHLVILAQNGHVFTIGKNVPYLLCVNISN